MMTLPRRSLSCSPLNVALPALEPGNETANVGVAKWPLARQSAETGAHTRKRQPHRRTERMVTYDDLESFLIRMDLDYEEVEEGICLVRSGTSGLPVVLHYDDTILLIRMKLIDLPDSLAAEKALYRTLLELNASEVVHGAYAIEGDELILSDTHELETLDFHELQASIESMELAASSHEHTIRRLAGVSSNKEEES